MRAGGAGDSRKVLLCLPLDEEKPGEISDIPKLVGSSRRYDRCNLRTAFRGLRSLDVGIRNDCFWHKVFELKQEGGLKKLLNRKR